MKATELTDIKCFDSDKNLKRFDYVKRSMFIVVGVIVAHFIYIFRFLHRDTSTTLVWTVDILIGSWLLIWTLTSKIVKQIQLDYQEQKFLVHYITPFSADKTLEVPFYYLTYKFDKEPTRHQPKKWSLKIFNNRRKVFTIETDRDGFSQQTIEDIVRNLNQIRQTTS